MGILVHSHTAAEEDSPFTEMPSPTLATTTHMENINQNFKCIFQHHLFDRILKSGVDASEVWDKIDQTKLKEGSLRPSMLQDMSPNKKYCPRRCNVQILMTNPLISMVRL
jgi:hypothetical protein